MTIRDCRLAYRRTVRFAAQCLRQLQRSVISTGAGRLAISAGRSSGVRTATSAIRGVVGRRPLRAGIVVTMAWPSRPRPAHLVPQEGDNGNDDGHGHEERRYEHSQVGHLAAFASSMNTTIA